MTTSFSFAPGSTARLRVAFVIHPRGVRREYPAGSEFTVFTRQRDAVLAHDPSRLLVRLPVAVLEEVAPGDGGGDGGTPVVLPLPKRRQPARRMAVAA